jgi:hypothetical protein
VFKQEEEEEEDEEEMAARRARIRERLQRLRQRTHHLTLATSVGHPCWPHFVCRIERVCVRTTCHCSDTRTDLDLL